MTLLKGHFSLVVLEGFEPSQAEPESDVLPLHHRTIPNCECKGTAFFVTTKKKINFFSKKITLGGKKQYFSLPSLFCHALGDAFGNADGSRGTDKAAEVTPDALVAHDVGFAVVIEGDGLMAAIHAGDVAPATADALVTVDEREDDRVAIQVTGPDDVGNLLTHQG